LCGAYRRRIEKSAIALPEKPGRRALAAATVPTGVAPQDGSTNAPNTDPSQPLYSTVTSVYNSIAFSSMLNNYKNASSAPGRYRRYARV
jgi:hypothetical protein